MLFKNWKLILKKDLKKIFESNQVEMQLNSKCTMGNMLEPS
jgi:hypothetical protein